MITDGFTYLAVIVFFAGAVVWGEKVFKVRFFKYVPAVVLIYLGAMLLSTFALWKKTDEVTIYYHMTKTNLLPAMIFLMLLRCDLRKIITLGPRMLLGFFTASLSIMVGFVIVYAIFKGMYEPGTWKSFAALSGSWMGGTGNMVAIQGALDVPSAKMGYALLMDSVDYAIWVMILLALIPFAPLFNKWTKSDTALLDRIGRDLNETQGKVRRHIEFPDLILLIGTGLFVSALSMQLAGKLPTTDFITSTALTVISTHCTSILIQPKELDSTGPFYMACAPMDMPCGG